MLSSGERRCDLFGVVFLAMRALLMVALAAPAASAAVDCKMSDWGFCGECTSPCGGGVQECARRVLRPASGGGMACPSKMYRTQQCNTAPCPTDPPTVETLGRDVAAWVAMCMTRVHLRVVDATSVVAAHGRGRAGSVPRLVPGETRAASMARGAKC